MNELLALQPFTLIYEGTIYDSMSDAGTTELTPATYNYAIMFNTGGGITTLGRIELDVATDGSGVDLTIEIRGNNFNPNGSAEGTLLKTIVVPKEFLPTSQAYWSIPINVTGLTAATVYWIIVKKAGDATNHIHLYSKGSEKDTAHKCYKRSGTSGAWTDLSDSIRFKVYEGTGGVPIHEVYGTNGYVTLVYSAGVVSKQCYYLPPSDGSAGGIRKIMTMAYTSGLLTGGAVT
jgi:hypothetical protein